MDSVLWERVGELADRAPRLSDLQYHKLQLVAASRMRARGEAVPRVLVDDQRRAAFIALAIPSVLRRVRATCAGPLVLMKGAELAARWPDAHLRPTSDIDLLAGDADDAQAALLASGFVEVDDPQIYGDLHHACPLSLPGLPLTVEVHRRPHWCGGVPPETAEIVATAQACAVGVEGILAPRPDQHAVLLAVHAWAHGPLKRIGHLADVATMLGATDPESADRVAEQWGVRHIWRATRRAVEEVLLDAPPPRRRLVWKRHLAEARERTVLEGHVARVVAPAAAVSAPRAPLAAVGAALQTVRRSPGETWPVKLGRSTQAVRHAGWAGSRHEQRTEDAPADQVMTGHGGPAGYWTFAE
jgi:hypothetical protein